MKERDETIETALTWLSREGYVVSKIDNGLYRIERPELPELSVFRIRKVIVLKRAGKLTTRFRHKQSQEDYQLGIRTLWIYGDQVGWSRDWFDEKQVIEEHKEALRSRIIY